VTTTILIGDVRERIHAIPDASIDCIIADPPYAETALEWDRWPDGWATLMLRVLKPSGSMWVFGSLRMFMERAGEFDRWKHAQEIVWEKHNGSNSFADRFRRVHELAIHLYPKTARWADIYKKPQYSIDAVARTIRRKQKAQHWSKIENNHFESVEGGPRLLRSVMYHRSEHGRAIHPTQKPADLIRTLLEYSCPPGGAVLSPFFGSGTDAIAAKAMGANCTGIELNPDYAELSRKRLDDDAPLFAEPILECAA
jgi:site-specific DNA-methyltransferase (adenine-specific)